MFKVITDIMAQWYQMINTILFAINFCNAKKMNSAFMFIISNNYGRKCLNILVQLEPNNDMFKVIAGKMAHSYELINTYLITSNFCNGKKMNCALMFIMSNHYGRKCFTIILQLEPCNDMFKVIYGIIANWYELINIL